MRFNKTRQYDICVLFVISLSYICLFLFFLREPISSDDCSYFEFAANIFQSRTFYSNGHRLGLIFSIKIAHFLFGYTATAYYFVPFLYSGGLILAFYFLCRRFLPPLVSGLACLLFMAEPMFLINFTILLPDIPCLFWFILGLGLYVRAFDEQRTRKVGFYLAGIAVVCFFLSYISKETGVFLCLGLPFYLVAVKRDRLVWQTFGFMILVGLICLCSEAILHMILHDDPFFRIHTIVGGHLKGAQNVWINKGIIRDDYTWWDLLFRYPKMFLESKSFIQHKILGLSFHQLQFSLLAVSILLIFLSRNTKLLFFVFLFVVIFLCNSLTVISFDPLIPLLRTKGRYYLNMAVLIPLLTCGGIWLLIESARNNFIRHFAVRFILLLLVVINFGFISMWFRNFDCTVANGCDLFHRISYIVKELGEKDVEINKIYSSWRLARGLRVFLSEKTIVNFNIKNWHWMLQKAQPGDMYVLKPKYVVSGKRPSNLVWLKIDEGRAKRGVAEVYYVMDSHKMKITK